MMIRISLPAGGGGGGVSTFKPYPEYVPTNLGWLPEMPEGWSSTVIKRGYKVTLGKMLQPSKKSSKDELCSYLRAANIQSHGIDISDVKEMWFAPQERHALRLVAADVLVSEGGDVGRSAIWQGELDECYFQNAINRIRATNGNHPEFVKYSLDALKAIGFIEILCNKSTIPHYTAEKVALTPILLPPEDVQRNIVSYLNRETARIDALIKKKTRFIELLKEKRQALITQAVTKGLDPTVPMKDSGVEWIGEVSAHWVGSYKLVWLAEQVKGSFVNGPFGSDLLSSELKTEGVPVIYIRDVKPTGYSRKSKDCVTEQKAKQLSVCQVRPGDVLLAKVGSPPGDACVYPIDEPLGIVTQDVVRIRPERTKVVPEYFCFLMNSGFGRSLVDSISVESTRKRFGLGELKQLRVVLPSVPEQEQIVTWIEERTSKIDVLIQKSEQSTTLLKERRSALITAAVTGQIDLREAAP